MPYKNLEKRKEYNAEYGRRHYKAYYLKNKDTISRKSKRYHEEYRDSILRRQEQYRKNNVEKIKLSQYKYRKSHREKINRDKNCRRKTDIQFKLGLTLRDRVSKAIKNKQRGGSAVRDLGCTIPELKIYFEKQFQPGMTWHNWAYRGWHIDHIIPLSFFDLTNREQFLQACHYTNLQPMWAQQNWSKGGKNRVSIVPVFPALQSRTNV